MVHRKPLALALVAALSLTLASCGGGSDGEDDWFPAVTINNTTPYELVVGIHTFGSPDLLEWVVLPNDVANIPHLKFSEQQLYGVDMDWDAVTTQQPNPCSDPRCVINRKTQPGPANDADTALITVHAVGDGS